MRKSLFTILLATLVVASMLLAGCRSKAKDVPQPEPVPTTETTDVPPPVPTVVDEPDDFVAEEPAVSSEDLTGSIQDVNERAHRLGWVRDVFFEFDSFALSADAQDALAVTASWLKSHPDYSVVLEGHCDERGTQQYNLALGDRRANVARDYLVSLGVSAARVRTVSYGEERPFAMGSGESAWAQNRRAHIVLNR